MYLTSMLCVPYGEHALCTLWRACSEYLMSMLCVPYEHALCTLLCTFCYLMYLDIAVVVCNVIISLLVRFTPTQPYVYSGNACGKFLSKIINFIQIPSCRCYYVFMLSNHESHHQFIPNNKLLSVYHTY